MLKSVIKRNGAKEPFNESKIRIAINNANKDVEESERVSEEEVDKILEAVRGIPLEECLIETIQSTIELALMDLNHVDLQRKFIRYRYKHELGKSLTKTEESVLGIISGKNKMVINENSNKDSYTNSTQRDLIAGEVSKTLTDKLILPDKLRKAMEDCIIHWHDKDYTIQPMINCFKRDTKFITVDGTRSFNDFEDGDEVYVYSHTGNVRKAVVRCYGKQDIYRVTFKRGNQSYKTVSCTRNHRWLLNDGSVTTNLGIGDKILVPPEIEKKDIWDSNENLPYVCDSIEYECNDEVWCLEVEEDKSFILSGGIVTGNCCLIAIKDMLDNGTVMNGYLIESPHSFQVACTVMTQIIAAIASNQYGGQSVAVKHLGRYLRLSRENTYVRVKKNWDEIGVTYTEEQLNAHVDSLIQKELESGVQTIQYQINTLLTTNGQSPFLTLFLQLDDEDPYIEETARIIEEILKQRIKGVKNESGVYITPSFPKLIYVLDENNCLSGGKYDYITELAYECSIKRSYPDYISAKKMREDFDGEVFSPMGCVDKDETVTYLKDGVVYHQSISRMYDSLAKEFQELDQEVGSPNKALPLEGVKIWDNKERAYVDCFGMVKNKQSLWYEVRLSNGRVVTVTDDHPFEVEDRGIVLARDLQKGDKILIDEGQGVENKYINSNEDISTDLAWLIGATLLSKDSEDEIKFEIKERVATLIGSFSESPHFVKYKHDKAKSLPTFIWNQSRDIRLAFLSGLIDSFGEVVITEDEDIVVRLGIENKELALQELELVQSLGYPARLCSLGLDRCYHSSWKTYYVEFDYFSELTKYLVCEGKRIEGLSGKSYDGSHIATVTDIVEMQLFDWDTYSYDVTTSSEHFTVSGIYSHNCRSFLSPWKKTKEYVEMTGEPESEIGKYKWEGRFNQGVVSINLPQIAIIADGNLDKFWLLLNERLVLCYEALMLRHQLLEDTVASVSPVHWMHGGLARLKNSKDIINYFLHNGYSTLSLGYIGIYETVYSLLGVSHTTPEGKELALKIIKRLRQAVDSWKEETGLGFGLYGTPAESLCYRFAQHDREKFGEIKNVTDKGYYTNSYHVDVREKINAFDKFEFESAFQSISSGGAISYVEIGNQQKNKRSVRGLVKFIYENIRYAEFNAKSDYCMVCGFEGEIPIENEVEWTCPCCGNKDQQKMKISRRTCGYLGDNYWNRGKTLEINSRVEHL